MDGYEKNGTKRQFRITHGLTDVGLANLCLRQFLKSSIFQKKMTLLFSAEEIEAIIAKGAKINNILSLSNDLAVWFKQHDIVSECRNIVRYLSRHLKVEQAQIKAQHANEKADLKILQNNAIVKQNKISKTGCSYTNTPVKFQNANWGIIAEFEINEKQDEVVIQHETLQIQVKDCKERKSVVVSVVYPRANHMNHFLVCLNSGRISLPVTKLFPNLKEITESMSAIHWVSAHFKGDWKDTLVLCVGEENSTIIKLK